MLKYFWKEYLPIWSISFLKQIGFPYLIHDSILFRMSQTGIEMHLKLVTNPKEQNYTNENNKPDVETIDEEVKTPHVVPRLSDNAKDAVLAFIMIFLPLFSY